MNGLKMKVSSQVNWWEWPKEAEEQRTWLRTRLEEAKTYRLRRFQA